MKHVDLGGTFIHQNAMLVKGSEGQELASQACNPGTLAVEAGTVTNAKLACVT